ncbi:ABC transporter substrate-binding protein [Roseibium sp. M-1]
MILNRLLPLVLAGLMLTGLCCGSAGAQETRLTFGAVFNLSGRQAPHDIPSVNGADLAVREINAAGGILGHKIDLVPVDGRTDPGKLRTGIERALASDPGILAYFGLSDTDAVLAAAPPVAEARTVFLTSGATSPKLPQQIPDYLFLACFGDNVQAAAAAEWIHGSRGARSAVILADMERTYPKLLQTYFSERFAELGGKILETVAIDPDANTWDLPRLTGADAVFVSVETAHNAARIVKALRKAGFDGPVLGGDGYDDTNVWSENADIKNVYFTTHVYLGEDTANPQVIRFKDAYGKAFPGETPTAFSALAYDAAGLLAAAVETSGQATQSGVLQGLLELKGYDGVTGRISFPDGSRIPLKSVSLIGIEAGRLHLEQEILPSSVPAP